jgi:hypothetical protein
MSSEIKMWSDPFWNPENGGYAGMPRTVSEIVAV